uniref:Acyl-CoA_dh_1 domain-containing protein n=1 Tax=Heterorhabditis bacteriophora TaxID=37862 RepID=A0A1I7WKQ7_HETBA
MRQNVFFGESRYVRMIAIKFSIDMILSRIGSLTAATYSASTTDIGAKCVKTCFSGITFDLLINDRHQILYRYDLISHRESHCSTYISLEHLQCIHYRHRCKMRQNVFFESRYVRMIAIKFSIDIILSRIGISLEHLQCIHYRYRAKCVKTESRYFRMIAIKFSIDMILSRIGSTHLTSITDIGSKMRQNVFFESRYVRMIAIKFSIDMILSRIGSLTGAPALCQNDHSRYVRMIAIKFSIDMILSRIGSLTGAPAVHPLPYTVESSYARMIAIKFSIDMILSRIGSLTGAPTVHPLPT